MNPPLSALEKAWIRTLGGLAMAVAAMWISGALLAGGAARIEWIVPLVWLALLSAFLSGCYFVGTGAIQVQREQDRERE